MSRTILNYPQITKSIVYELGIETTKQLNEKQDKLKSIKWNDGESNLDTEYSELACEFCMSAWDEIKRKQQEYREIDIRCEIPDINITFKYPNGKKNKQKIELKSSKSKKMPGSTIRKLDINQTLIYCLRPSVASEPYIVRCSQYHTAMGESDFDLFQDRTPRPIINFEKMSDADNIAPFIVKDKDDWPEHYIKCALKRVAEPEKCKGSWQDVMIKRLKKRIIDDFVRDTSIEEFQTYKNSLQVENTNI